MKLLIDADACPVTRLAVKEAKANQVPCILFCDTAHTFSLEGAETVTVSKGADSADFALVNQILSGDLVITQDYGLAAMSMTKTDYVMDQNGRFYTKDNIDALLMSRYEAKKVRMSGGRLKGPKARSEMQNEAFLKALQEFFAQHLRL